MKLKRFYFVKTISYIIKNEVFSLSDSENLFRETKHINTFVKLGIFMVSVVDIITESEIDDLMVGNMQTVQRWQGITARFEGNAWTVTDMTDEARQAHPNVRRNQPLPRRLRGNFINLARQSIGLPLVNFDSSGNVRGNIVNSRGGANAPDDLELRADPNDRPGSTRPSNIANVADLPENQLLDFDEGMNKLTRQERTTLRNGGTVRRGGLNFDAEAVQDMRQRFSAYRSNLAAQKITPNSLLGPVRDDTELVQRRVRMQGLIRTPVRLFGRMMISPGVQMAVYENLYRTLAEELLRIENLPADQRPQARQEYIQTRNEIIGAWFVNVLLAGLVVAPASAISAILANIQEDRVRAGSRFRRFLRSAGRNKLVKLLRYVGTEYGLYQLTNLGMQQDAVREAILEYARGEFLTKLNDIGYGLAMAVERSIDENWPDSWSQTDSGSWDEISDRFDMPSPSDVQPQPETQPNRGTAERSSDLIDPNELFQ